MEGKIMQDMVVVYKPRWLDYFKKEDGWLVVSTLILLVLGLGVLFCIQGTKDFDWAGTIFGFVPVIPIVFLWFVLRRRRWVDGLPIYLNIQLKLKNADGRVLADVHYIPVQDGMDIRQIAQSVLRKVNKGDNVEGLEPFIRPEHYSEDLIRVDGSKRINDGKPFELREVCLVTASALKEDGLSKATEGKKLFWCPLLGEAEPRLVSLKKEVG